LLSTSYQKRLNFISKARDKARQLLPLAPLAIQFELFSCKSK
jgi:hypothetical protein